MIQITIVEKKLLLNGKSDLDHNFLLNDITCKTN